jgi:hypothetical protein
LRWESYSPDTAPQDARFSVTPTAKMVKLANVPRLFIRGRRWIKAFNCRNKKQEPEIKRG